jgi:hypothetical protein
VPGHLVSDFNLCVPLITEPFFNSSGNISQQASVSRATVDAVWAQIVQDLTNSFTYPKGNDHIIEEFIIPRDSFELAISLNKLGAIEQHATVELLTFIKTCKLADTFMQKNKIG